MAERQVIEDFEDGENIELNTTGETGWIDGINSYTVLNPATGRNVTIMPGSIRNATTQIRGQRNNLRVGSQVEFREGGNWVAGTLIAKNYRVNMDDGSLEVMPHTILRREAQAAQVQAQAAAQPAGVAWEIHNAFPELNFRKFMTIVRKDNNGASNFKDASYPLQPLITYINNDKSTTIVDTVNERTKERIPEKTNLTRDLNGEIKTRLNMYLSEHPESKDSVMEMIQFIMSQGPDYKDPYIRFLAFDCVNAYGPGGASCTKGVFERVFLINKSVLIPLCSDDTSSSASSAASSSATCKPVYRELLGCFYPDMDINALFGEWYAINNLEEGSTSPLANANEEERKEDFRRFVLRKVPRADPTAINNYIDRNENTFKTLLIGGRRKRSNSKKIIKRRQNKTMKKRSGGKKRRGSKKQRGSKKRSVKKL